MELTGRKRRILLRGAMIFRQNIGSGDKQRTKEYGDELG